MKQEDIMAFEMASQELENTQAYINRIDDQLAQVNELLEGIEKFETLKEGSEALVPLANGIFAEGTITNAKTLHINVGQGIVVPHTIEEARKLVKEQQSGLKKQRAAAIQHQEEIYMKLAVLEQKATKEQQ